MEMDKPSRRGRWGLVLFSPAGGWCLTRGTRAQMQELQQCLIDALADEDGDFAAGAEEVAQAAAAFLRSACPGRNG
jgi:hypothetical protein